MTRLAPRILSLATAVPAHAYRQDEIRAVAGRLLEHADRRLLAVFDHNSVGQRHLCMPLEWYEHSHTFGEKNDVYQQHALALAQRVTTDALAQASLAPTDIDHVLFVSTTGLATPSLDARLANALGFRSDVRRTPVWGLGCAGGAAGVARAVEFARAAPASRVLVVAVELCTLAFQPDDEAKLGAISASLFSDGAAAVIVGGAESGDPGVATVVASGSVLWPDTLDVMGWTIDDHGLHVVMRSDIPQSVRQWIEPAVGGFLRAQGLGAADVAHWLPHPGGAKVLDAIAGAFALSPDALAHSRTVLRENGNMSSPTCLFVLRRCLDAGGIAPGEHGLVFALGPGFTGEMLLLGGVPR